MSNQSVYFHHFILTYSVTSSLSLQEVLFEIIFMLTVIKLLYKMYAVRINRNHIVSTFDYHICVKVIINRNHISVNIDQYLYVILWIPVRIINDNSVSCSQVNTKTSSTCAKKKYKTIRIYKHREMKLIECYNYTSSIHKPGLENLSMAACLNVPLT